MFIVLFVVCVAFRSASTPTRSVRMAATEAEELDMEFVRTCEQALANCVGTRVEVEAKEGVSMNELATQEISPAISRLEQLVRTAVKAKLNEDAKTAVVLARLAAWFPDQARPLDDWNGTTLEALATHVVEKYDAPEPLRGALFYLADHFVDAAGARVAYQFCRAYAEAGGGVRSVRDALRTRGFPKLTKKAAAAYCSRPRDDDGPLRSLRRAQVDALGGPDWLGDSLAGSKCGGLWTDDETFLANDAFLWLVSHADALQDTAHVACDFLVEMRRVDPKYACKGRTPKTIERAMEAYTASTVAFTDDEAFLPNSRGLRPFFSNDALIPKGTRVHVPYDGNYDIGVGTAFGSTKRTLRVEEVLSLKRLIYEGEKLDNCLETKRYSQIKYLTRARQRTSSFWSFTLGPPVGENDKSGWAPDDVKHILLLEVWHLRDGNIVRQAEGPRPRTLPSPEAWYWMVRWCEQNNVDWTTWNHYSQLYDIIPAEPL